MKIGRVLIAIFLLAASLYGADKSQRAPIPAKILSAKTVFLSVQTDATDFHREAAFKQLTKWNRWTVVDSPDKADLVLFMTTRDAGAAAFGTGSATTIGGYTSGSTFAIPIMLHHYYLHVIDRESNTVLWTTDTGDKMLKSHEATQLIKNLQKRLDAIP